MPKTATAPKQKTLLDYYNDLNEAHKAQLRSEFNLLFEVKSTNTFYTKIRPGANIKTLEKSFFASFFNTKVDVLFPTKK